MTYAQVARPHHRIEHNPEEDARACIDLLKAKNKKGAFNTNLFVLRPC